jgi:hypothetical protein
MTLRESKNALLVSPVFCSSIVCLLYVLVRRGVFILINFSEAKNFISGNGTVTRASRCFIMRPTVSDCSL